MARVSLGVILPGNPDCVQKPNIFIRILGIICKYGWIASPIGILTCFIMLFVSSSRSSWISYSYDMFRWLGFGIIMLLVSNFIWDEKRRCEYCHHFFSLRRISDDKFVSSAEASISRSTYETQNGIVFDSNGNSSLFTSIRSGREHGKEITNKYTHNVRCRCCGAVCKVETSKTTQHY